MMPLGVKSRAPSQLPSSPSFTSISRFSATGTEKGQFDCVMCVRSQINHSCDDDLWLRQRGNLRLHISHKHTLDLVFDD